MPATLALHHVWLLSIAIADVAGDDTLADFGDLGKDLLGGFVLAVVVAIAYTFIKLRWRDQNPPEQFISITSLKEPNEPTKAVSRK